MLSDWASGFILWVGRSSGAKRTLLRGTWGTRHIDQDSWCVPKLTACLGTPGSQREKHQPPGASATYTF